MTRTRWLLAAGVTTLVLSLLWRVRWEALEWLAPRLLDLEALCDTCPVSP